MSKHQYVFSELSSLKTPRVFLIAAINREAAIKQFATAMDGRFGFFKGIRAAHIKTDIREGNLSVQRATRV
jgi:hypothetical protein